MSDKAKKKTIGYYLERIILCGIGLTLGHYLYHGFINPPVEDRQGSRLVPVQKIISEGYAPGGVLSSRNEEIVRRHLNDPSFAPQSMEEVETEESEEEVDPAEAERLANWKANFPYKPTTDPDVVVTEAMLEKGYGYTPIFRNHGYMRHFFENETRFTAQFEQLYRILEEHGRGDNPMATGDIFEALRRYHADRKRDPEEIARNAYDHRENRHSTYGELVEDSKEVIVTMLQSKKRWPDREFLPEEEAIALRDRIITEIQGTDKLPTETKNRFAINLDYGDELEPGDSPLVLSPGWQAAYDKWDRERNRMKVDKNNVLLAGGKPVLYDENRNVAGIITPDGYEVPLHLDEDGKVIIPTPAEIDEMIENGEGKYVGHPADAPNQAPPPLDEEWKMEALQRVLREAANRQEWKMQEARRILEEAARQQE